MKTAIIIPARYGSSRLPGKPLLNDTGKYLIQHVCEQAAKSKADDVVVATDDDRIFKAVQAFGGKAEMTREDHQSGTDRVAEVAQHLDADIIVNLQGDEPLIDPNHLNLLLEMLAAGEESVQLATLAVPVSCGEEYNDPNCVKVVCDGQGRALYFSRSPIPCARDGKPQFTDTNPQFLRHVGLYAYRREFLLKFASTPVDPLEKLEKLEQLRALRMGAAVQVGVVKESWPGIDTPKDYLRFVRNIETLRRNEAA